MTEQRYTSEPPYRSPDEVKADLLRDEATKRLKDRRDLQAHVLAYVLVNGFLTTIWVIGGAGFFWPIFPMFGWGIGLAFHIWGVISPEPSEDKIQAEMRRLAVKE